MKRRTKDIIALWSQIGSLLVSFIFWPLYLLIVVFKVGH